MHRPVMVEEVIKWLNPKPGDIIVDATVGGAGHSKKIMEAICPDGRLIGIDRDPRAIDIAQKVLKGFGDSAVLVRENYVKIKEILKRLGIKSVNGVLMDLGVSSFQLDDSGRGFSFQIEGPLDMRMDPSQQVKAQDLVNQLPEKELTRVIRQYGEERLAKRISRRLVQARQTSPIKTTLQLAKLVEEIIKRKGGRAGGIHPATKTFQAFRIAVNAELDSLSEALPELLAVLAPGGRICAIAFHSLEDRIIKQTFQAEAKGCICPPNLPYCACGRRPHLKILTKRAIKPSTKEIDLNPRARSAKLRCAEKLV